MCPRPCDGHVAADTKPEEVIPRLEWPGTIDACKQDAAFSPCGRLLLCHDQRTPSSWECELCCELGKCLPYVASGLQPTGPWQATACDRHGLHVCPPLPVDSMAPLPKTGPPVRNPILGWSCASCRWELAQASSGMGSE